MDEGWTRFVLEKDLGVDYETLHDVDVARPGLAADSTRSCCPTRRRRHRRRPPGRHAPEEYTGGLGETGVPTLRRFVEAGGTLIALNAATRLPVEAFGLGVATRWPRRDRAARQRGRESTHPVLAVAGRSTRARLAHGLGPTLPSGSSRPPPSTGGRHATYTDTDPLLSGWLRGGRDLTGKAALVELPLGHGRVVLFGFRPQYRAQSWGTYVTLLNAISSSAATPAR